MLYEPFSARRAREQRRYKAFLSFVVGIACLLTLLLW